MPKQSFKLNKKREKVLRLVDEGTIIPPYLDFMVKLWLRIASKENLCRLIGLFLPGYTVLDITILEGEILPLAWKRMLKDGSIVTEVDKTYHLDNRAIIKVKHPSDPKPFLLALNIEAQSRDRIDLVVRQELYMAGLMSAGFKRGQKYTSIMGKLRALGIVLCVQNIKYFADPMVCDDPERLVHRMGGFHYKENLNVSTNASLSIFVELNKLRRKPENDRIVLGSPLLGAFSEALGGLHTMNRAQAERVMDIGGKPVIEFAGIVADISDNTYGNDIYQAVLSKQALHEADVEDARAEGEEKGRAEGRAEGQNQAQREVAQKLILRGFHHDEIAQLTGLSVSEIKELS